MKADGCMQGVQRQTLSPKEEREYCKVFLKAMEEVMRKLTRYFYGKTKYGPFSESYIGEPAVNYFSNNLYVKFMTWERKEDKDMVEFLWDMVWSNIGQHLDKWRKNIEPGLQIMGPEDEKQIAYIKWVEEEVLKEIDNRETLRNITFRFAEAATEREPELKKFLKAIKATSDYRSITKRMKMTVGEVKEVEERLLERVKSCVRFAEAEGNPELKRYLKTMKMTTGDNREIAKRMNITIYEAEKMEEQLLELVKSYAMTVK